MEACVQRAGAPWFHQSHRVRLVIDGGDTTATGTRRPRRVPGAHEPARHRSFRGGGALDTQPATVPRIFLLVALLFLRYAGQPVCPAA